MLFNSTTRQFNVEITVESSTTIHKEIVPKSSKVYTILFLVADGIIKADGSPIYEAKDMKVGLFQTAEK